MRAVLGEDAVDTKRDRLTRYEQISSCIRTREQQRDPKVQNEGLVQYTANVRVILLDEHYFSDNDRDTTMNHELCLDIAGPCGMRPDA